jgi:hypothetical protein
LKHPDGTPIAITGLWDLEFGGGNPANGRTKDLYFDAGFTAADPAGNGLFGMIVATRTKHGDDGDAREQGSEPDGLRTAVSAGGSVLDTIALGHALGTSTVAGPTHAPSQPVDANVATTVGTEVCIRPVSAPGLLAMVAARRRLLANVLEGLDDSTCSDVF